MTTDEILKFMQELGAQILADDVALIEDYFNRMIKDRRVHAIYEDGEIISLITFSIGNDYHNHYFKDVWEYQPHDIHADTVYVDKLMTKVWNSRLRKLFSQKLVEQFPALVRGVWHRPRLNEDDLIITHRRFTYV